MTTGLRRFRDTAVLLWLGLSLAGHAGPYAPGADQADTTALHMSTNLFVSWATGWTNYVVGAECWAMWQTPERALGAPGNDVSNIVCLGRGGQITMTFDTPITDGPGFDFAVFENAFVPFASFLDLAYVEVSSDGTNYIRFPNDSRTPDPVGPWGYVDTTDLNGLAGKYRIEYGTPFDLANLAGAAPTLDVHHVEWVRLVDVVGDGSCLDSDGDPVYDPYPTIQSAGFDLDAVGVINTPLTCQLALAATGCVVSWQAHTNRIYQAECSDDGTHWSPLGPAVTGAGAVRSVTDTNHGSGVRMFRTTARVQP